MYRGPFDPFDDPFFGRQRRPGRRIRDPRLQADPRVQREPRPEQKRPEPPRPEPPASLQPVPAPGPDTSELKAENERLRAELKAVSQRYVELQQDLERLRARQATETASARREGLTEGLRDQLEILDALDRALASAPERHGPWFDGLTGLRNQVLGVLARRGVTPFGLRGDRFDPSQHEAVGTLADPDVPDGTVARIERAGYRDGSGTVIRPAQVVVAQNV